MEQWKRRYILKVDASLSKGDKGDKGDPGDEGSGSIDLPLSSDDVDYRGDTLTDVLDNLLYVPLQIQAFTALPSVYEKGQTITSIQFAWTLNKAIESQSITGSNITSPTLLISDRAKLVTTNLTSTTIVTLTADDIDSDSNVPKTRTLTIEFLNKIYYGKSIIGTINNAFILALTGELKNNRTKSFNLTTGLNEYIWFASPVAYGIPSFKTNGFDGGLELITTLSFTNASGHTENYYVYRSTNHNLGLTNVDVL